MSKSSLKGWIYFFEDFDSLDNKIKWQCASCGDIVANDIAPDFCACNLKEVKENLENLK